MKNLQTFDEFINESKEITQINEYTDNHFQMSQTSIDMDVFKKLMPKTAATVKQAEKRIKSFEGGYMFIHVQSFTVTPHGNNSDKKTYQLHQRQLWLRDKEVNVTVLSIYDVTDPKNEIKIGIVHVDTQVFLKECPVVFQVLKRVS